MVARRSPFKTPSTEGVPSGWGFWNEVRTMFVGITLPHINVMYQDAMFL